MGMLSKKQRCEEGAGKLQESVFGSTSKKAGGL